MVQHLTLNSFAIASPDKYNGVIQFFEGMPKHILYGLKALIWLPLIFHAVYGLVIAQRGEMYNAPLAKKWRENRYYVLQRVSGIVAFLFLCYHMVTTSIAGSVYGQESTNYYHNWEAKLSNPIILGAYILGVIASSYHLSYGIWNFCIRWGITISDRAQQATARFAAGAFVALTLLGWAALVGFFLHEDPKFPDKGASVEATAPTYVAN